MICSKCNRQASYLIASDSKVTNNGAVLEYGAICKRCRNGKEETPEEENYEKHV